MKNILIFWKGLPACSALINSLARCPDYVCDLVYTRPAVPFQNLNIYLDGLRSIREIASEGDIPSPFSLSEYDLVITTGWYSSSWNRKLLAAKKLNTSLIVAAAIDNIKAISLSHRLRQVLGILAYRSYFRNIFDYCFVPGTESTKLMRYLGHNPSRIYQGYYGASRQIYASTLDISLRPKQFLFVGQIIHRKGIDILIKAYKRYRRLGGDYGLTIVGSTNHKMDREMLRISADDNITFLPFSQPNDIAQIMNSHRVLIAPSRFDHWATVVCEAAACGCLIIASSQVGASSDLIKNGINGFIFNALPTSSFESLAYTMKKVENLLDLDSAQERSIVSQQLSSLWSEDQYRLAVEAMFQ